MKVNAIGLACPLPVIETKKALEAMESGTVEVIVDNAVARENVKKLASKLGYDYEVKEEGDRILVSIVKGEGSAPAAEVKNDLASQTIAIASETMGNGDDELGTILMKGFIYTLTEAHPYPKMLLFYNGGVKLACQGAETLEDLHKLEEAGVEILVCGTCLNFFGIADQIAVGSVSNMYDIVEGLKGADNTIVIS
jgi:selenium metabolism protein YedF